MCNRYVIGTVSQMREDIVKEVVALDPLAEITLHQSPCIFFAFTTLKRTALVEIVGVTHAIITTLK